VKDGRFDRFCTDFAEDAGQAKFSDSLLKTRARHGFVTYT
jgi:hypothetical protein